MNRERVERRLAAILAADIAGYARLIGADEEGTLAALRAIRGELGDPKIAEHKGRIVKTTGDGLLVEFASVVDALRCAAEVQAAMRARNADVPAERRIEFRIGIHQGDIVVEADGDILGDGVNIAARLEGIADPGGICVSARVQEDATGRLDVAFEDLGEQALKNIARPIRVYRVRPKSPHPDPPPQSPGQARGARARVAAEPRNSVPSPRARGEGQGEGQPRAGVAAALPLPDKPSIAVLPFQNMSGDPEQEYFVDGMVEEITTALSRIRWLFVIARNSSFTYKGQAVDVKRVGHELGVRYVLEGSVRKSGNRVRITGQLIDAESGAHLWADRFDGSLEDVFDLQDQVASSVAGVIEPKLRQSEIERSKRKATENLGAYDLYLRALAQSGCYTEQSVVEAVALLRRALAIDPSYAPAAALVGWCRWVQVVQGWAISSEDVADGIRLARLALDAARDEADAMWQAGYTLFILGGETAMAETFIDRALALNPNASGAWVVRGWVHALRNQSEAAVEAFERAQRLSPFDPLGFVSATGLAAAHLAARCFNRSIEWADRALHDQPRWAVAMRIKIVACAHSGRLNQAQTELGRLLAVFPGMTINGWRTNVPATSFAPQYVALNVAGLRLAGMPEG